MEWISVEEKLPDYCENVLIYAKGQAITGAYLMECNLWIINDWDEYDRNLRLNDVSHWMPLPKPPQE